MPITSSATSRCQSGWSNISLKRYEVPRRWTVKVKSLGCSSLQAEDINTYPSDGAADEIEDGKPLLTHVLLNKALKEGQSL